MSTGRPGTTSPSTEPASDQSAAGFVPWLDTIDPDIRQAIIDPRSWLGVTVIALVVIGVAGLLPATRDFFQLRASAALLCFLPTPILGLLLGTLERNGRLSLASFGFWCLVGSFLFQAFMWSLVALSRMPGATVMSSFPIFLAAYHGQVFRSSPKTPYVAVAAVLGIACAVVLNHDPAHLAIYGAAGPVAIGSALVLGRNAVLQHQARLSGIALREAVDAQILSERARHVEVITQALNRLHGTSHDAGNALTAAQFNLEQLSVEVARRPLTEARCERIGDMSADLLSSLARLRELLERARDAAHDSRPALERVDVPTCISEVVDQVGRRFPGVRFQVQATGINLQACTVPICGGAPTLHRILTNLVLNACQGTGGSGASGIEVTLSEDSREDLLSLTVADDGPGFSEAMLKAPFRGFHTTKAGGTGLGLYTTERLVRASGGALRVVNAEAPDRGGRVHVAFRR
jgi:two-component system C4-dicarboxylate transport sensor histidine kinase DctB